MISFKRLLSGLVIVLVAQAAHASMVYTNTRGDIGTGYTVDWADLGPEWTEVLTGEILGEVTLTGSPRFTVFSGSTFNADFLPTDSVLSLFDVNSLEPIEGEFELTFANAVRSVGAQVQSLLFGEFTGWITAFDSGSNQIGSFVFSGETLGNGEGKAVFAGVVSDSLDISRVVFSGFGAGAAVNWLSVGNTLNQTVPEPESFLLALTALIALSMTRRRRA